MKTLVTDSDFDFGCTLGDSDDSDGDSAVPLVTPMTVALLLDHNRTAIRAL